MKSKGSRELLIEVDGQVEKLDGKWFYSLSTDDNSTDIFIEADGVDVDLSILTLNRWLILVNKGKSRIKTKGFNILNKVCVSTDELTLFLGDYPIKISTKGRHLFFPGEKIADKIILFTAILCFSLSSFQLFIPEEKKTDFTEHPSKLALERDKMRIISNFDGIHYSNLREILLTIKYTKGNELEKILHSLILSRKIYEKKGMDESAKITGQMIGGINRYLKYEMKGSLNSRPKRERFDNVNSPPNSPYGK